ncbi:MAG: helix-turn-helix domain-containing protein [Desulfarculaceae bacterium]|nr:helix-turn-helix domain-containing protein [Desulfarculaceae bacterium]
MSTKKASHKDKKPTSGDSARDLKGFVDRLRVIAEPLGGPYALIKKAGFSPGATHKWLSGNSEPGLYKIVAVAKVAGVRLEWLATGQGPMRDGGKDDSSIGTGTISIPCYDLQTLTGHSEVKGALSAPPKHFAFQSAWLRDKTRLNHEDLLLVKVVGDAMVPTLNQGDVVLANRAKAHVPDDGLYVLLMDGTMLVKRLRKRPGRKVQVISDNEAYGSFDLDLADPPEDMTIIGRVVWFGREI